MSCPDIGAYFHRYVSLWMKGHPDVCCNMEQLEDLAPELYDEFVDRPCQELGGVSPKTYFLRKNNPEELITLLRAYDAEGTPSPDLLLERIVDLGVTSEQSLFDLVRDKDAGKQLRLSAVSMLQELESLLPMHYYIEEIAKTAQTNAITEAFAASLSSMGETVSEAIFTAVPSATEDGLDLFADIVSGFSHDLRILELLLARFEKHRRDRAIYASYLAKYGDEAALPCLIKAVRDPLTGYLDFEEISNAIEALGGDRPGFQEYSGDPDYELLKENSG